MDLLHAAQRPLREFSRGCVPDGEVAIVIRHRQALSGGIEFQFMASLPLQPMQHPSAGDVEEERAAVATADGDDLAVRAEDRSEWTAGEFCADLAHPCALFDRPEHGAISVAAQGKRAAVGT